MTSVDIDPHDHSSRAVRAEGTSDGRGRGQAGAAATGLEPGAAGPRWGRWLGEPRAAVLIVLFLIVLVGGGRKLLRSWRGRGVIGRLGDRRCLGRGRRGGRRVRPRGSDGPVPDPGDRRQRRGPPRRRARAVGPLGTRRADRRGRTGPGPPRVRRHLARPPALPAGAARGDPDGGLVRRPVPPRGRRRSRPGQSRMVAHDPRSPPRRTRSPVALEGRDRASPSSPWFPPTSRPTARTG